MYKPNPSSVRFYRCDKCGRQSSVTVINPREDDDKCDCGGRFCILEKEIPLNGAKNEND